MRAGTGQGCSFSFFSFFPPNTWCEKAVCWHLTRWRRRGGLAAGTVMCCVFLACCPFRQRRALLVATTPTTATATVSVCLWHWGSVGLKGEVTRVANKAHPSNPCDLQDIRSAPLQCSRSVDRRRHLCHLSVAYLHPPYHLHLLLSLTSGPWCSFSFFLFLAFLFNTWNIYALHNFFWVNQRQRDTLSKLFWNISIFMEKLLFYICMLQLILCFI